MQKKDTKQGSAVVDVLKSDAMLSVSKEYVEVGIDSLLDSGVLKDIPMVSTLVGVFNVAGSVRDQILSTKILRFLHELTTLSKDERIEMIKKLNEDDKFANRAGTTIVEILDRMESEKKPEIAARCFAAYSEQKITFVELRRVLLALERVPSFDLEHLSRFSAFTLGQTLDIEHEVLLEFVNAGLAVNNGGFDGGTIVPTTLCELLVELDVVD